MIYGERVRLRAAERDDLPRFCAWINDPEVRANLGLNLPLSLVEEESWYQDMIRQPAPEHVLVIEIRQGETWLPVGSTGFTRIDWPNRSAEIGIMIGEKAYWNQGYGRDTMRLMLKLGFETLNLNRIFLYVLDRNIRGIKAYERAGFQHEGQLRQAIFRDGRYFDLLLMSVLREEWQANPIG